MKDSKKSIKDIGDGCIKYDITWNTGGLFRVSGKKVLLLMWHLFGSATACINTVGFENRAPTAKEMEAMKAMVRTAMEEGAMGVGRHGMHLVSMPNGRAD
jgi:N-acyl-D-amino-acid deacylase